MKSVLFVCHGNICRSPMAKYIFKYITDNKYEVDSRATSTEEIGNDIYPPIKDVMNKYNIPYDTHHAKQITMDDYNNYDYIIVFDNYNKESIKRLLGVDDKVRLLLPYEIDDPWYTRDFETAYKDIYKGCNELKEELK